ncbi:Hypp3929 [Branchiostoma lanceolatum]|uniref:Hypp3929 protein n=1 Tax=Branchiostoma lanceolatum TaxID=7740 RepID=A0A8K0A715_BRALA|nr:Hypp3929 [Branchiostoma lanceolatum]
MKPGEALLLVVSLTFCTSILAAGPAGQPPFINRLQKHPGWHGNSFSQLRTHLLIGFGVGLPLFILLVICILCVIYHFCFAAEPVVRTEFSRSPHCAVVGGTTRPAAGRGGCH